MIVAGIEKFSTVDFPGNICCVVFTRGCDINCFYCHNRQLISRTGETICTSEVFAYLRKRQKLLDGVVISGGEPTLQPDLADFCRQIQDLQYHVKLDTNGLHPDKVQMLLQEKLVDYVAVDLKATEEDYLAVCGKSAFPKVQETIGMLLESGLPFEARTTLYPGLSLDKLQTILQSVPPLPAFRLNYFRMPEQIRKSDTLRFHAHALTQPELFPFKEQLLSDQPNLIL